MDPVSLKTLQERALVVRRDIVGMLRAASAGSLFSSFSAVELLVWLYGAVLRTAPGEPDEDGRDRFVLSRVSATPALYAVLAERGFFGREELWSYARLGSLLQAAPDRPRTPGVDVSCGAPGMGAGIALGLALALKDSRPTVRVFCLMGAEELMMGATWEALDLAAARAPENLTLIVECPKASSCGRGTPGGFDWAADRLSAMGCRVARADGHDYASLEEARSSLSGSDGRFGVVLARTVHGRGLPSLLECPLDDASVLDNQVTELLIRGLKDVPS